MPEDNGLGVLSECYQKEGKHLLVRISVKISPGGVCAPCQVLATEKPKKMTLGMHHSDYSDYLSMPSCEIEVGRRSNIVR